MGVILSEEAQASESKDPDLHHPTGYKRRVTNSHPSFCKSKKQPFLYTGTYSQMLEELEAGEVAAEYESLKARAKAMDAKFNEAIEVVKAANNNEFTDLCSRHLYELAANCVMSQLMLRDATKAPELFEKSMKVYLNLAEAEVAKHYNFVKSVNVEAMESYKQV